MNLVRWLAGLILGLALGWAVGRMYAPAPGSEMRRRLQEQYRIIAEEAEQAAESKRQELRERYLAAKRTGRMPIS